MAYFSIAFKETLELEGGYVNDKYDKGGETMYGITSRVARANGYSGPMDKIPQIVAEDIYHKNYWKPLKLDEFPQEVANKVFDTAVNCGAGTAGKLFQKAINLMNYDKYIKKDIHLKEDGKVGPATISAFRKIKHKYHYVLIKILTHEQYHRYKSIVEKNPVQFRFFMGWVGRRT